jgi:hypothetical protein
MSLHVDEGFLNQVIRGVIKWKKCCDCDKYGIELQYYDENGNPVKSTEDGAERGKCCCTSCGGIGYIDITTDADLIGEPE